MSSSRSVVETRRDRKALVADAGYKPLSLVSVLAGVVAAYGAFAVLAGLAVGVVSASNAAVDLRSQWHDLGVAGGLVIAGLLLVAYLFGGYIAGRMARRGGTLHGVVVFVVGVVLAAGAAWLARQLGGADIAGNNLRDLGLPTTANEWRDVATVAGIASLAAMAVGAILGGMMGERWHDKLLRRALDPDVGAEADARRVAARRAAQAEELRTDAFRRVRATNPVRTRRVDGEADDDRTREVRVPATTQVHDGNRNGNRNESTSSSFWWHRTPPRGTPKVNLAKDRPTARSGGRTA